MKKLLTEGEYKALCIIWNYSPTPKPSGVSIRTLNNLEDKGLLNAEIKRTANGGGLVHYWLTDAGKLALDQHPHAARLAKLKTFEELQPEIVAWQRKTFPKATSKSIAVHLSREARELLANPKSGPEIADVVFLAIAAAAWAGVDLMDEVRSKFAINLARTWGEPDADGVVEHIEPARGGGDATVHP